jgi:methylated-DNA-[protein]-cysteine S-methyltransferase
MIEFGFALFDTAIGSCAIAWGERGLLGVQLPEGDAARERARMRRRFPSARETSPPADVQRAVDGIVALIAGEAIDFSTVALDMERVPAFHRDIAKRLGVPAEAREVGEALGKNPFPIIVPCHRVLAAGGKLGGFSAPGGVATKRRLLAIEGARATAGPDLFDRAARAD